MWKTVPPKAKKSYVSDAESLKIPQSNCPIQVVESFIYRNLGTQTNYKLHILNIGWKYILIKSEKTCVVNIYSNPVILNDMNIFKHDYLHLVLNTISCQSSSLDRWRSFWSGAWECDSRYSKPFSASTFESSAARFENDDYPSSRNPGQRDYSRFFFLYCLFAHLLFCRRISNKFPSPMTPFKA